MSQYIAAIDQGTTSTRCMVFDHAGAVVAVGQKEHRQIFPRAGWVEHDAQEIWTNVREVVGQALGRADLVSTDLAAVGLTNQRFYEFFDGFFHNKVCRVDRELTDS